MIDLERRIREAEEATGPLQVVLIYPDFPCELAKYGLDWQNACPLLRPVPVSVVQIYSDCPCQGLHSGRVLRVLWDCAQLSRAQLRAAKARQLLIRYEHFQLANAWSRGHANAWSRARRRRQPGRSTR
eukprot:726573-Rhodomonas_salina.1